MIIITDNGALILLQGKTGTTDEGVDISVHKAQIESIVRDNDDHGVVIAMYSGRTYELRAYETETAGGVVYTDAAVLYADLIAMANTAEGASIPLGTWNAITNVPFLEDGAFYTKAPDPQTKAPAGSFFHVSAADADVPSNNTTIDGINTWVIGDMIRSDGNVWYRIPYTEVPIIAEAVIYDNTTTLFPDISGEPVDDVQKAVEALSLETRGSIGIHSDVDVTTTTPTTGDSMVFNGTHWVPAAGSGGGRVMYNVSGTISTSEVPTVDGYYVATEVITNPIPADINDILLRNTTWSIVFDASANVAGAGEIQYINASGDEPNYVWDGSKWSALDAYEPAAALNSVNVSNPIGDITISETGASLRGRSISRMLDDMLFKTEYTAPSNPSLASDTSILYLERGSVIPPIITYSYSQNGGGPINSYKLYYWRDGVEIATETTVTTTIGEVDISTVDGIPVELASVAFGTTQITNALDYDDGPIPTDNKGNTYPGDQILASTTASVATYIPKYGFWVGSTTEYFSIDRDNLEEITTISIDPNSGTGGGGSIVLDGSWVRAWTSAAELYQLSSYTNRSFVTVAGSAHALIIVPPGVTMSSLQENVVGNWATLIEGVHYGSLPVNITGADDTETRTHTCYYIRNLSSATIPERNLRFTTTGTPTV